MNLELNVVRFNNEDVIATSGECEKTVYTVGAELKLFKNGLAVVKNYEVGEVKVTGVNGKIGDEEKNYSLMIAQL